MAEDKYLSVHVDIDSPAKLLSYWGVSGVAFGMEDLEIFYEKGIARTLELFSDLKVKATYFCVGNELEASARIRSAVKKAHDEGHEIANHSHTHLIGLDRADEDTVRGEVSKAASAIAAATGKTPVGFRSPGYCVDGRVIDILESMGYAYDASGFWSSINALASVYRSVSGRGRANTAAFGTGSPQLPPEPYYPSRDDWQKRGPARGIMEIPMPRTRFLRLPFYGNFHLMTPSWYRSFCGGTYRRGYSVYLTHLIEYLDIDDGLPEELSCHPNVRAHSADKIDATRSVLQALLRRHRPIRTDRYVFNRTGARDA